MFYVISYDIPDDRRRGQLAKVLKGFGTRVQYSVFEAHLNRIPIRRAQDTLLTALLTFLRILFATTRSVVRALVGNGLKSLLSVK